MHIDTPFYLIDQRRLQENLTKVAFLRKQAGIRVLFALKCFSTWPVFHIISPYMDGTTSSSVYEARLGYEEFGKEVHAYSVAFSDQDVAEISKYAEKVIFNSPSQLQRFQSRVSHLDIGLRINPQVSYSPYPLADPATRYSRLGTTDDILSPHQFPCLSGVMFHNNCENADCDSFAGLLHTIAQKYGHLLATLRWVSLGGGIDFTSPDYALNRFSQLLQDFARKFDILVYLEPGDAIVADTTSLITTVLDVVKNEVDIAIVDSSIEAHMLDLLTYQASARITGKPPGPYRYLIAGQSCLAGDIFGEANFDAPLKTGDRIRIEDAGGYTMVKMNWFNGLRMPSIVVAKTDGSMELLRQFSYRDFKYNLG